MPLPKPNREFRVGNREPKSVSSNRKRTIVSVAAVAVTILSIMLWVSVRPPAVNATDLKTSTVRRGDLSLGIAGYGKLVPSGLLVISSKSGGQVASIEKQVGAILTAGSSILAIENPDLQQRLREAEKTLAEKRVDLMTAESNAVSRRNQVTSEVQNLSDDLRVAKLEVKGLRILAESKIITPIEFEKASIRASTLHRRIENLSKELRQLDRLSVATAAANSTVVATLNDDVVRLRREVGELSVKAPADGTIFEMQSGLSVGSQIVPGAPIARLSLSKELAAEIAIPAARAQDVAIGQSAVVRIGGKSLPAKVKRIDPQVLRDEILVALSMDKARSADLFAGQPISGEIIVGQHRNVMHVMRPAGAVEKQPGVLFELDASSGELHRREVNFGSGDSREIIVEHGLREGAIVVLDDMQSYSDRPVLRARN